MIKQIYKLDPTALTPSLALAAYPSAVFDVGPHLVEVAAKTACLNLQLALYPAHGLYFL